MNTTSSGTPQRGNNMSSACAAFLDDFDSFQRKEITAAQFEVLVISLIERLEGQAATKKEAFRREVLEEAAGVAERAPPIGRYTADESLTRKDIARGIRALAASRPATLDAKRAEEIKAVLARFDLSGGEWADKKDAECVRNAALLLLSYEDQFAVASYLSANLGYQMQPEPLHPDTPELGAFEFSAERQLLRQEERVRECLQWFIDDIDGTHTTMLDFDENLAKARAALRQDNGK